MEAKPTAGDDDAIRKQILAECSRQSWAPMTNVAVRNGMVELWGVITDERERQALIVASENVPGVKAVHDHLMWLEPMSGFLIQSPEDEASNQAECERTDSKLPENEVSAPVTTQRSQGSDEATALAAPG